MSFEKLGVDQLAFDGFYSRKTRYGAWKERYFRTDKYLLTYYSEQINEIKANRLKGSLRGPYRYKAVGSPSESIDLRIQGTKVALSQSDELVFDLTYFTHVHAHKNKSTVLEIRAGSAEEARRCAEMLNTIMEREARLRKVIGSLSIEIDGAYLIGGKALDEPYVEVHFTFQDQVSRSNSAHVTLSENLTYENFDESHDAVATAPVTFKSTLQIFQASSHFSLTLTAGAKPASQQTPPAMSFGPFSGVTPKSNKAESEPEPFAERTVQLFELAEESAARRLRMLTGTNETDAFCDHAAATSALEGEIGSMIPWPALAPDGSAPRPGWQWFALYEEPPEGCPAATSEAAGADKMRMRCLVQAKIEYATNIVNQVNADGHERFEGGDAQDEFTTEQLAAGVQRLSDVADQLSEIGSAATNLLAWKNPRSSFIAWLFIVGSLLYMPDHAALACFPVLLLFGIVSTLPAALAGTARYRLPKSLALDKESLRRGFAEVSVDVIRARNLIAGDVHLTREAASDPYVACISVPPPPSKYANHRVSQMLIGLSSVKPTTLNPDWQSPEASATTRHLSGVADHGLAGFFSASQSHFSLTEGVFGEPSNSVGRNAAALSTAGIRLFGDTHCMKPPVDFRTKPPPGGDGSNLDASWTYPVLQETDESGPVVRLVPWEESRGAVEIELYDQDLTQEDDFLGGARVSIADLVKAEDGTLEGWVELDMSPTACKNGIIEEKLATTGTGLQTAESAKGQIGTVYVRIRLRELSREAPYTGAVGDRWEHAQALCRRMLEPAVQIETDKKAGVYGKYKSMTRTMKSMQDAALVTATQLERFVLLLSWVHPEKTLLVVFGLCCGIMACCLIPNKLLVAGLVTKLFLKGLMIKLRGRDESEVRYIDKENIQLANLLSSLPNATQHQHAYAMRTAVWARQQARSENRVRLGLHYCFKIKAQLGAWIVDDDSMCWTHVYVAVVNGTLIVWPSLAHAADNKPPRETLLISGPAVPRGQQPPPGAKQPPAGCTIFSLASKRAGKSPRIRDFFLAVKTTVTPAFADALKQDLVQHLTQLKARTPQPQARGRPSIMEMMFSPNSSNSQDSLTKNE